MLPQVTIFLFIYLSICTSQSISGQTLTYECTTDKHIILDSKQNMTKVKVLKGDGTACNVTSRTLTGCDIKPETPVHLMVQDDSSGTIVGGLHSKVFQLTCTDEGVYTVSNAPSGIDIRLPIPGETVTGYVHHDLTLTIHDQSDQVVNKNVGIGQELKLVMKINDGHYILSPQKCTATGTVPESYVIWETTGNCNHDSSVIDQKWKGDTQALLTIKMYGFYFLSSKHVTIECTTKVCKTTGGMSCPKTCLETKHRRRREAPNLTNATSSYEKTVQVAFDVVINEAGVNSAIGLLPKNHVYALIGITLYTVLQLIY